MTDLDDGPSLPEQLPDSLIEALDTLDPAGLHAVDEYVEERLESIHSPLEKQILEDATGEVVDIEVTGNAPIDGKTLIEAADEALLPEDVLIVAIDREGEDPPITPRGSTRIEAGDLLTVYSASGLDPGLTDVFGYDED